MGGQFRENWKRLTNQILPKTVPTALEDKDVLRVEDLNGLAGLVPASGSIIVGSGTVWTVLPLGAPGLVLKSIAGTAQWGLDASGVTAGFVVGPASATNNSIAIYDGITGKLIKVALATIDASGNLNVGGNTLISGDLTVLGSSNLTNLTVINNSIFNNVTVTGIFTTTGPIVNSVASGTGPIFIVNSNTYFNAIQSGVTTVFMPGTPLLGQQHVIKDIDGVAGSLNITVNGSGNTIDGLATAIIATDYGSITLILGPSEWNII